MLTVKMTSNQTTGKANEGMSTDQKHSSRGTYLTCYQVKFYESPLTTCVCPPLYDVVSILGHLQSLL